MNLPTDFKELLEAFARESVEFAVVGGYAVAFHARPRATKDLDILLDGSPENLERAANALEQFGAPRIVVSSVRSLGETEVVFMGQPPLRIDFLRTIDGVNTTPLLGRSVRTTWSGVPVRVIGLDDLIENKRAAGRPQDRIDVEVLEKVRRARG
ncbi:MAG TPA: nucleotidyltransferase [Polyangiaceae bacterium]|nr:nucleotidyltransferase [Polyangiaceae bacterium]